MFYIDGYLYSIFSYSLNDKAPYVANDIAIYKIDESNNTLVATLKKIYECDYDNAIINNLELFEFEGIAAVKNTSTQKLTFYVDVNQRDESETSYDYIYNIGELSAN